jgi:hypothetical protein
MAVNAFLSPNLFKAFDNNGVPLAGGKVFTYAAGTVTPIATWTDYTAGFQNPNPVVLNYRGEAPIYLLPNIAYKFLLTDASGNTIPGWPVDQILNNQLLTLYGGVDTGSANAYVLNYTANFSSLIDGIVIYFKASNTNTGPSTLNVNGLGVVNIIQQTGAPLVVGMIPGNSLIEVLYLGGSFYLISSAYTSPQAGNFTMTVSGFNPALPNQLVSYTVINNVVTLTIAPFFGISNSTFFQLSGLPLTLMPATSTSLVSITPMVDNGAVITTALALITPGSTLISLTKSSGSPSWTASGQKGNGNIVGGLPPQIYNTTITYPLT